MNVDSRIDNSKRDFEKELNLLKLEYIKFLKESNELDGIYKKKS